MIISKCRHVFDRECIRGYIETCADVKQPTCPVSRISLDVIGAISDLHSFDRSATSLSRSISRRQLSSKTTRLYKRRDKACSVVST